MNDIVDEMVREEDPEKNKTYDLANDREIFDAIQELSTSDFANLCRNFVNSLRAKYQLNDYRILFLFDDEDPIEIFHSNKIYEAAKLCEEEKSNILLVIQSPGGRIEPAYLISKMCRKLCNDKFVVAVPRRAKSAATLIALGANEIHMGLMSELGPIDPQINGYPALGLVNALYKLAEMSTTHPKSSEMFASFLAKTLELKDVGYFERVSESAAQYAERLLVGEKLPGKRTPQELANHFVNHYKDHGFVIDIDECEELIGKDVIKSDTPEYKFSNDVFRLYDKVRLIYGITKKKCIWHIGGIDDEIVIRDLPSKTQ